jgi:hypothetical protein
VEDFMVGAGSEHERELTEAELDELLGTTG